MPRHSPSSRPPSRPAPRTPAGLRSATGVLLALALLFGSLATWREAQRASGIDFYQFWAVGRALGARADVYSAAGREEIGAEFLRRAEGSGSDRQRRAAEYRRVLETYSTPLLYSSFRALGSDDYDRSLAMYRALLFTAMAAGVGGFCRLLGYGGTATAAALVVLLFWFEPFLSDLRVGNVNAIQLGLLAAFVGSQRLGPGAAAPIAGGAILALGTMFKPNLAAVGAFVVVSWALRRRYRALALGAAGAAAAAIAAIAFASLSFGTSRGWFDWLAALRALPDDIITTSMGNFALARLLDGALGGRASAWLLLVCGATAAAAMWAGRPASRAAEDADPNGALDDVTAVALGSLFTLLVSRLVWLHYYVLAVPMLLLLLRPLPPAARVGGRDTILRRVAPALALVGIAITPIRDLVPSLGDHAAASIVCASAVLLFAAGLVSLTTPRARSRPGE